MTAGEKLQNLKIESIKISPTNPRKDLGNIEELAKSIKVHGIQQPLVARKVGKVTELVFGHRRLAAAKKVGLKVAPVIIRAFDDDTAREVQLIENLQRESVHPLDEADGFKGLQELGYNFTQIADRVGRSAPFVAKRIAMAGMPDKVRKLFDQDKLSIGALEEICKIEDPKQRQACAADLAEYAARGEPMNAKRARAAIERNYLLPLEEAPFPLEDEILVKAAGACTTCPKRSSAQSELFSGHKVSDRCLDPACYRKKLDGQWRREKRKGGAAEYLSGQDAQTAIGWEHGSGSAKYYKAEADIYLVSGGKVKVASLIRKHKLHVSLAKDPRDGRIVQLAKREDVDKAIRSEQSAKKKAKGKDAPPSPQAKERREKKQRKELALQARTAAVAGVPKNYDYMQHAAETILHLATNDALKLVCKRRELDVVQTEWGGDDFKATLLREMNASAADRKSIVFEIGVAEQEPASWSKGTEWWRETVAACGVDLEALERELAEQNS